MPDQPWHELPAEIAGVLRPALDDVATEMMEAVRTVPAYARPLDGPFGDGIRAGVQEALRHFLAEIEAGGSGRAARRLRRTGPGRDARRAAASTRCSAPTGSGARVAWRRFAAAGADAGLEPETLYLLAESIFAYIDVLSAESAEGYALEQSAAASEAELRRRRLVRLLVREPAPDAELIEAAAGDAGWRLPRKLAVLADGRSAADQGRPRAARRHDLRDDRRAAVRADPRPRRPGAASVDRARRIRRGRARGAGNDRRVARGRAQLRAGKRRARAGGSRSAAGRRARARRASCCCARTTGSRPTSLPTAWRRFPNCPPDPGRG